MHPSTVPLAALALLSLAGCAALSGGASTRQLVPGDPAAPSQVTPDEAIGIAEKYVSHAWRPFARNILHGPDSAGITVHTPDASLRTPPERPGWWLPGELNRGVPYKWGGFDDLGSFERGVADGFAAGDVSSPAKRRADNAAVSTRAAGVDCSGFVSRCLKLPTVYDTSQLPSVCDRLSDPLALRPGDLLNIPRGHVVLCAGWARPDRSWLYYFETGGAPDYWKPGLKQAPLAAMLALGYQPLRYRGMAHTPYTTGKEVLTRSIRTQAAEVPNPTIGEP